MAVLQGLRGRGAERATFELCAGLLHEGGLEAGHFRALTCWHGTWWICDDAYVTPSGCEGLAAASAETYGVEFHLATTRFEPKCKHEETLITHQSRRFCLCVGLGGDSCPRMYYWPPAGACDLLACERCQHL